MSSSRSTFTAAIADRYRVESELGRGAIKVLSPQVAEALGHGRFLREIEMAAQLTHPHTLPLFDSGLAGEQLGLPVARQLLRSFLALAIALSIAISVADANAAAPTPTQEELERLRSLPYTESSKPGANDTDGVTIHDTARSQPGLNLYSIPKLSVAELIDEKGVVLRSWRREPPFTWEQVDLLPNGDLLVVGADPPTPRTSGIPDSTRYIARFDWDGKLLWRRPLLTHHDAELTPDGRLLALTFERKHLPKFDKKIDTRDDLLTLLDEEGNVLESVSLLDAFARTPGLELITVGSNTHGVRPWVDLFHANSIEWMHQPELEKLHPMYGPDHVLFCLRHQNRIAILNWPEKRIVWSWGLGELLGPHDAQVLPDGHILVFDNGMGRRWSRVIELDPLTNQIVWEYRAPEPKEFYTLSKGSCQRLANGNTLISESDKGRAFEVTAEGEIVWEFVNPHRGERKDRLSIGRIRRIDRAAIDAFR